MYSLSNLKGVFILYLFPLFSIILEIITSENYNVRIKLSEFSGFYLILILPLALVLIKKSYVKKIKLDFKFNFIHHLSIALFSVLLLSFLLKNINTFNIYEIGLFSERYRNGFYKGSGLFTYYFLNIVPFLFTFQIIKQKNINKTSWLLILVAILLSLIVFKLRIYLINLSFSLILIVFEKRRSLLKLLMIFCLGYSLFLIPKVLSGRLLNSTSSTKTKVISSLTRMNYSTLVADNKEELLLLYLEVAIDGRAERINNFKKKFYEINVNNFNLYFHKIGTYSGIAIPLQVVFFNSIGYLAVPFLILLILVSFYLVKYAYISSSKFKSFTALFFSYCILGSFFEDINSISRFTDYSIVMIYFFVTTFDIKKGIFTDSQNKYFVQ